MLDRQPLIPDKRYGRFQLPRLIHGVDMHRSKLKPEPLIKPYGAYVVVRRHQPYTAAGRFPRYTDDFTYKRAAYPAAPYSCFR